MAFVSLSSAQPNASLPKKPRDLTFWESLTAGALAGGAELLVMYPLDTIKTRAQLPGAGNAGVLQSLRTIVATEGAGALYRGILAPLSVEPVKRAVKFGANGFYRNLIVGEDPRNNTSARAALCGLLAGSTEAVCIAPAEVAKVRLQSKEHKGRYNSTADCIVKMWKAEGPMAFMQGLEAAVLRNGMWNMMYFGVIFNLKQRMSAPTSDLERLSQSFAAGVVGGVVGTTFNNPFDVVASRMRFVVPGAEVRYKYTIPSLATIAKEEGFGALYRGYLPKLLRLGPGGGILLVVFDVMARMFRGRDSLATGPKGAQR